MAFLKGFGAWLPPPTIGNEEMAALTGKTPAWILSVSGIEERHVAADETVADLAVSAAWNCLDRCGLAASSLGMVIVASGSAERRFPGPGATVAHRLGLSGPPALDLPVPSVGSLVAVALAARLAPDYGNILVVGAEKMFPIVSAPPVNPGIAVLFGDGAGACVVSADSGVAEILETAIYSDGAFSEELCLPFDAPLHMNGRAVIMQASRKIPRAIEEVLQRRQIAPGDVDAFLLHQANQNLIDGVARALGVPPSRFYSNIRRYGNTSAASMLIALSEWSDAEGFRPGLPVVLAGFGAGFNWGAVLAQGTAPV
jgi:3-oxoacyl-[acyl-carrier-protein] synthase-3